ncbi:hypothetical protein DFH11DRAFT_1605625 [Phellopilus nigrolimitatus]|nr:hypothetical protein DFH11DRAFT_1605625 [Phellopilus nigrolimitatus]
MLKALLFGCLFSRRKQSQWVVCDAGFLTSSLIRQCASCSRVCLREVHVHSRGSMAAGLKSVPPSVWKFRSYSAEKGLRQDCVVTAAFVIL